MELACTCGNDNEDEFYDCGKPNFRMAVDTLFCRITCSSCGREYEAVYEISKLYEIEA